MDIVVGGSYHNKNWDEVVTVINKLKKTGHNIVAPGNEWEPININDEFVKFRGEENIPIEVLQSEFYRKINIIADAFVVVDRGGYLGSTVTKELLFALIVTQLTDKLKKIYFTETPLFYDTFREGKFTLEDFEQSIKDKGLQLPPQIEDIYPFYMELYRQMSTNKKIHFVVGIDELLQKEEYKEKIQFDHDER